MEYERVIMSLRSSGGISSGDMYSERIWNASSWKLRSRHSDSQLSGNLGISSGIKRPPSAARPLITTSSKENCIEAHVSIRCWLFTPQSDGSGWGTETWKLTYTRRATPGAQVLLRIGRRHLSRSRISSAGRRRPIVAARGQKKRILLLSKKQRGMWMLKIVTSAAQICTPHQNCPSMRSHLTLQKFISRNISWKPTILLEEA